MTKGGCFGSLPLARWAVVQLAGRRILAPLIKVRVLAAQPTKPHSASPSSSRPRTTAFHAVDRGSNPLGDAKKRAKGHIERCDPFFVGERLLEKLSPAIPACQRLSAVCPGLIEAVVSRIGAASFRRRQGAGKCLGVLSRRLQRRKPHFPAFEAVITSTPETAGPTQGATTHFLFEMLGVSSDALCRFAKKTRFSRSLLVRFEPGGAVLPLPVLPSSTAKRSGRAGTGLSAGSAHGPRLRQRIQSLSRGAGQAAVHPRLAPEPDNE